MNSRLWLLLLLPRDFHQMRTELQDCVTTTKSGIALRGLRLSQDGLQKRILLRGASAGEYNAALSESSGLCLSLKNWQVIHSVSHSDTMFKRQT